MPSDAGGEIQQLGQRRQVWNRAGCISLRADALGDCRKRGDAGLAQLSWQRQRLQSGVSLEGQGLIVPIQEMQIVVDAGLGMLGRVVVAPSSFKIGVRCHLILQTRPAGNTRA